MQILCDYMAVFVILHLLLFQATSFALLISERSSTRYAGNNLSRERGSGTNHYKHCTLSLCLSICRSLGVSPFLSPLLVFVKPLNTSIDERVKSRNYLFSLKSSLIRVTYQVNEPSIMVKLTAYDGRIFCYCLKLVFFI